MRRVPDFLPVSKQDIMQRCQSALRAAQRKIEMLFAGAAQRSASFFSLLVRLDSLCSVAGNSILVALPLGELLRRAALAQTVLSQAPAASSCYS